MVSYYSIFGKQVPSHILAILTLGSAVGVAAYPKLTKKADAPTPAPAPAAKDDGKDDFDLEKIINDLSKEEPK